jgi:hypothetical protein
MTLPGLLPENEAAWVPAEFKSINHHQSSSIISSSSSSSSFQIRVEKKNTTLDHWTNWTLPKKTQHWTTSRGNVSVETRRPALDQVGEEASAGHKILTLDQPRPLDRGHGTTCDTHDWP